MSTFTWTTADGTAHEVDAMYDVDEWTGREMRAAERINGGNLDIGAYGTSSLVFAISIARAVAGYTVERADAELTFGRVRAIIRQLREREAAATAAAVEGAEEAADEEAVLSPTSAGSEA